MHRCAAQLLRRARILAAALAALVSGCAAIAPQTSELHRGRPDGLPERAELTEVPFFAQQDYQCGPAALANSRVEAPPADLVAQVYLPTRRGSLQVEMQAAPRRYGMVSYRLAPRFEDLLREVAAGNPVVVLQDFGVPPFSVWHYAVVVGYDYRKEEVVLRSGDNQRLILPFGVLEYTWKASDYWALVVMPPDRLAATAGETGYLDAIAAMERASDAQAARTAYATFLARWPRNLAAAVGLANAHYDLGQLHEAEAVLRRAAADHPKSPVALNNLAQTLSDLGRQGEALALIDRAVALGSPLAATLAQTRELILRRIESGT